jgi:quercetin dioxygenase-like cupin family protein
MNHDAVAVAPDVYEVLFENDRVRVLNVVGEPGSVIPMHRHPDSVVHALKDASIEVSSSVGESRRVEISAGSTFWTDENTHSVENVGDATVRLLRIELKP